MNADPERGRPADREIYARRHLEVVAARWDAKAGTWDKDLRDPACHLNEDDAYGRFLREVRLVIEARRDFCASHGVIDAGCGTGLVLADLSLAFAWGMGLDISPEMVRLAADKRIPRSRFVVADCFQLASVCPPAGAVLSRGVLLSHYGPEQGAALLQAGRDTLTAGGFLVFDFLNQAARARHSHQPKNKTYFTAESACRLARQAGFAKVTVLGGEERRVRLLIAERD